MTICHNQNLFKQKQVFYLVDFKSTEVLRMNDENTEEEYQLDEEKEAIIEDDKDKQIAELTDLIRRTQAEFENYKRRVNEEREQQQYRSKKDILAKILPIIDMFELALKHKDDHKSFVEGMEMIQGQLHTLLQQEGVEEVQTENFDPKLHEAVATEEGEKDAIQEVVQRGYKLNDEIIRCAKVKVGTGGENE